MQGQLSEFHTLHVLLGDLVEAIVEGLPLQASLFTQPCRDNALYLLSLVDELILGEAFDLLPVRLGLSLITLLFLYYTLSSKLSTQTLTSILLTFTWLVISKLPNYFSLQLQFVSNAVWCFLQPVTMLLLETKIQRFGNKLPLI